MGDLKTNMLRFKINHSPRPKKKNNTLGYPVMKKGKERRKGWEVQRTGIQRPMKGKGFKFHVAKEMPSQPKLVSQKKLNGENWAEIPENARAQGSLGCIAQPE